MPRTGFIDHIGIGVPDLAEARQYHDELMSVLGLKEWFDTGPGGPLNYGPDGATGSQLFFYQAEPGSYSRHDTGLHHHWLDPHGFKLEAVCHTPEDG